MKPEEPVRGTGPGERCGGQTPKKRAGSFLGPGPKKLQAARALWGSQRAFVEKKAGFDIEARGLLAELAGFLGLRHPALACLAGLRIFHRYDAEGLDAERFRRAVDLVLSEPQCDRVFLGQEPPGEADAGVRFIGVEYLPGQYDQRADSAEQCIELAVGVKPAIRAARFYALIPGELPLDEAAVEAVKRYLINPVDSCETSVSSETPASAPAFPESAGPGTQADSPGAPALEGFRAAGGEALARLRARCGLAMSGWDLSFCQSFFKTEGRDPSLTELRILDTYWSDHCRHSTFTTVLEDIAIDGSAAQAEALKKALALYEAARGEVYGPEASARPRTLMDMAVIGAKVLKKRGLLPDLDESKEINACTVKVEAEFVDGSREPWLLLFKNETHNHPTEIEPFGGAATCLGGAIRDPLSGRAFVYQAMRVSGGGDPRKHFAETLPGKLPQLKIAREAAAGYSSYGNQIGIATGQVAEFYHPGFIAKRMELGAVIGAVPQAWVRREEPEAGDLVILVGGKTGRDGIGGATGSSKAHSGESVEKSGAEVQKGNAVEERKLQRLFRSPELTRFIKRCNDFGAGGVAVAVGELADGLDINLDAVPKKYAGLDGTELAISESQERMAVVVAVQDADEFIRLAAAENLGAVVIAIVRSGGEVADLQSDPLAPVKRLAPQVAASLSRQQRMGGPGGSKPPGGGVAGVEPPLRGVAEDRRAGARGETSPLLSTPCLLEPPDSSGARLRMFWQGEIIADLPRVFLNTNGAPRRAKARISAGENVPAPDDAGDAALSAGELLKNLERELGSLRSGSRRGLQERFDGSIGAASVLFPWGGETQGTPECGMAALIPSLTKESLTASLMSFGYDPDISARDPYEGAKGAVREALAKFVCLGGQYRKARLSFQEYFERTDSPESWGKPAAALLGALEAQLALAVPAIGGKDSMSGSYQDEERGISLAVPPSLAAFAAGTVPARLVRSGALSGEAGNIVLLLSQGQAAGALEAGEGEWERFKANMETLEALNRRGLVKAAYPVGPGGIAASLALMAFGNMTGLEVYAETLALAGGDACQGSALVELSGAGGAEAEIARGRIAARTLDTPVYRILGAAAREEAKPSAVEVPLAALRRAYESPLAQVYPQTSREAPITEEEAARARAVITGYSRKAPRKTPRFKTDGKPLAVLPVFPGTNCEWDMERAFRKAGARTRLVVFRNRNQEDIAESIAELAAAIGEAQILALSGGFSAGDEPDGSGKFIANVFRSQAIADAAASLLEDRDGLALGICNGFQALIKLGLVPYGTSRPADETMPTLTFNRIGRHVSRMVRTRVMSTMSPWLSLEEPGAIQVIPVSHGEGRVVIREDEAAALFRAGQVPFCYAGAAGEPALSEPDNPNGSDFAIEALTSPDGRVLGKMGHSERCGDYVHINIPGNKRQRIFEAGVRYFE